MQATINKVAKLGNSDKYQLELTLEDGTNVVATAFKSQLATYVPIKQGETRVSLETRPSANGRTVFYNVVPHTTVVDDTSLNAELSAPDPVKEEIPEPDVVNPAW